MLAAENEFGLLRELCARMSDGASTLVDGELRSRLCDHAAKQALQVFDSASPVIRGAMVLAAALAAGLDVAILFREHIANLDARARTYWMAQIRSGKSELGSRK